MMLLKSAHLACNNNHSLTEQTPPPQKKVPNYLPTSQIVDRDTENQLYF